MKRFTFIVALFFIGWTTYASTANTIRPNYGEAFIFVEKGVEFAVYPNGEFDFYYNPRFINTSPLHIDHPGYNISYNSGFNYDPYLQFDDFGAVIQIEHVPVFYDYYGRIAQAGDVVILYDNIGRVARIGGMKIRYNSFNQPVRYIGFINGYNRSYVYRPWHQYYVRPHASHRIVYYEPYRAYYQPIRYDYIQYVNYYQNNNYYYNKSDFYRPGQQVTNYNYGRKTLEQQQPAPGARSNINTEREYANSSNNTVRSNVTTRRSASNNSYSTDYGRQSNMEQHQAAVRAQRGRTTTPQAQTQRTVEARDYSTRNSNASTPTTETRVIERPATVSRSNNSTSRAESAVTRRSIPETTSHVQSSRTENNRSNVRSSESSSRSSAAQPVSREASEGRRSSGIRG